ERQRKRWRETTASLFALVGVADFPALEEACRVDAERRARAEALVREAGVVDAERTALGDPTAERERLSARIVELGRRLEGGDMVLIEAAANAHGTKSPREEDHRRAQSPRYAAGKARCARRGGYQGE